MKGKFPLRGKPLQGRPQGDSRAQFDSSNPKRKYHECGECGEPGL
jgi:hypothetical protein